MDIAGVLVRTLATKLAGYFNVIPKWSWWNVSWYEKTATLLVFCLACAGAVFAQSARQKDGTWRLANPDTARTSLRDPRSTQLSLPKGARVVSFMDTEIEPPGLTGRIYTGVIGDLQIRFIGAGGSHFHGMQPDTTLPFAFYNSHYPNPSSIPTPPFALLYKTSFTVQVLTPEHAELGKFELDGVNAGSYWIEPSESGQYVFQIWYNGESVYQPIRFAYVR